jgi:hypothetical protein
MNMNMKPLNTQTEQQEEVLPPFKQENHMKREMPVVSACCPPTEQVSCCQLAEKATCCGSTSSTGCGCK